MFNVILLGLTSLLTDISSEMVYPLIPLYLTTRLGASPAVVGVIEGIAESLASILKVFSGYISDKFKRRKPLTIAGYAGSTIGKIFLYISTSWWFVLIGRVVDRFGKGIRTAPRDAMVAEASPEGKTGRTFGIHRAMDTAGAAIGVLLAYLLLSQKVGDYTRIFLYSLIPAFLGIAVLFFLRERKDVERKKRAPLSLKWSALDKRLKAFLIVTFLFTLGNSSNQFLLIRAQKLGFSATSVVLLYLVYNLVYAVVSYPAGRLSDKIGRKTMLVAGYAAYGLVYLGFALSTHQTHIWMLFALYGIYSGITDGVEKALVSDIAPSNLKATMIGLHATLVGIGLLPASLLAGLLWNVFGAAAPFYFGGGMGFLAAIGLALVL